MAVFSLIFRQLQIRENSVGRKSVIALSIESRSVWSIRLERKRLEAFSRSFSVIQINLMICSGNRLV